MASTPTRLMTFAEYEQVPNPSGGRYELRHGELAVASSSGFDPNRPTQNGSFQFHRNRRLSGNHCPADAV